MARNKVDKSKRWDKVDKRLNKVDKRLSRTDIQKRESKAKEREIPQLKDLSLAINQRLLDLGKNQEWLVKETGISKATVSAYYNAESMPNGANLIKLAEALQTTPDYLLGFTVTPTVDNEIRFICEKTGLSEKAINNILNALPIPTSSDADEAIGAHMDALNMLLEDIQFYQLLLSIRLLYISAENMKAFEIENQAFGIPGNILINFLDIIHGNSPTINPTEYYNFACIQLEKDFIDIVKSNIDGHLDSISDIEKQLSDRKNSFMEQSEKLRKKFEEE